MSYNTVHAIDWHGCALDMEKVRKVKPRKFLLKGYTVLFFLIVREVCCLLWLPWHDDVQCMRLGLVQYAACTHQCASTQLIYKCNNSVVVKE
jgi:hypothetical protein